MQDDHVSNNFNSSFFLDNEQTPKLDMKVTWIFFNYSVLFPFRRGCRDRIKVVKYEDPFTVYILQFLLAISFF
jgi:hypothetical protein